MNQFVLTYMDQHRAELEAKYSSPESFITDYVISDEMMQAMIDAGTEKELAFNEEEFNTSKRAIEIRLKALIGRNLFDYSTFYQVVNDLNPAYLKAIETLESGEFNKFNLAHKTF